MLPLSLIHICKTSIATDTILNQKDTGVLCIYVAIGQKASSIARVAEDQMCIRDSHRADQLAALPGKRAVAALCLGGKPHMERRIGIQIPVACLLYTSEPAVLRHHP